MSTLSLNIDYSICKRLLLAGRVKYLFKCQILINVFSISAVYLCKRTMQNKARLELADYEAENLARLQKMFSRKWEFIFMQAEAQSKVDKKRDKLERKVLDSQERAFWDVHRPVVSFFVFYHRYLNLRFCIIDTQSKKSVKNHTLFIIIY